MSPKDSAQPRPPVQVTSQSRNVQPYNAHEPPLGAVLRNGFLIIRAVHNEHSGRSLFWLGWLPVQPALSGLTSRRAPILGQKRASTCHPGAAD
jgi:hypothetical protein